LRNAQRELFAYQPFPNVLTGRIILVTGATGGIGSAISFGLAAYGARLIVVGKTPLALDALCDRIERAGYLPPSAIALNQEGAGVADYDTIADSIRTHYARLDGMVLNAAMLGEPAPLSGADPMSWARVMQVNLHSNFLLLRSMLPQLAAAADASIVFTSADVGRHARAYWGAYAVSKCGLEGLMQVVAAESTATSIRANSIDPGATRTKLRTAAYPAEDSNAVPNAESLVPAYVYLLGPASKGVNGERLSARPR
jgi:NAD(P)-dependent dehydrogenase (short-subunit alcohol dehydrogenase family)